MPAGIVASKAREVFEIPELFSAILIHLPTLDLFLCAPLVSRSWNNSIASSPSLQSSLFFHPRQYNAGRKQEINPLLQAAFPPWFHNRPIDYNYPTLIFTSLDWSRSGAKLDAYSRKEASWRRMLPVQPPPKILEVVKLTYWEDEQFENRGELQFKDGIRMGTLYDLGYQTLTEPVSLFWISWPMFPDIDCQDFGWVYSNEDEDEDEFGYDAPTAGERIIFTMSCRKDEYVGRRDVLGPEFRSEGYKELANVLGKTRVLDCFDEVWNYDPSNYGI